jgi:hypothetical protein
MDRLRKILKFLGTFWIFISSIYVFGLACTLSSHGILDELGLIMMITVSLFCLEKNKRGD